MFLENEHETRRSPIDQREVISRIYRITAGTIHNSQWVYDKSRVLIMQTPMVFLFCASLCDLWAKYIVPYGHIPRPTFHIPPPLLSARVRAAVTIRHLLRWLLSHQPPPSVAFAEPQRCAPPFPQPPLGKGFPLVPYHCFTIVT